jgi:hypothetical protein
MNTPITFDLARLAKQKGFDEKCNQIYYDGTDELREYSHFLYSRDLKAPTIAEMLMWLYEKHKIWIHVRGDCEYKFKFEINTWKWYEPEKTYRLGQVVLGTGWLETYSDPFNSPTEAYLAAIEYTLKNIIK